MFSRKENRIKNKLACLIVAIAFITNTIGPWAVQVSYAQTAVMPTPAINNLGLPPLGAMVDLSPEFKPTVVKGLKVYPDNPFHFDFIVDVGQTGFKDDALSNESSKLIKYFLAALTVPEQDMWVNLSPYEKERIIPAGFGQTEMGRDLLAQDYLLKQVTSSLIYPENELGEIFWERVYQKAYETYGTMDIAVSTFNKVWIVPEFAEVYENADTALIVDCQLKVLTEYDYLAEARAQEKSLDHLGMKTLNMTAKGKANESLSNEILRDIVIPEIEKEINTGKNFVQLRQIYHSLILATWFKRKLKASVMNGHTPVLEQVYIGKNKVGGVDIEDKGAKEKIYEQYLAAFKKGVFNFIKEDYDPRTQQVIPRKYFSGGAELIGPAMDRALLTTQDKARGELAYQSMEQIMMVKADITRTDAVQDGQETDAAMLGLLRPSRIAQALRRNKPATYAPAELTQQWQFNGEHDPDQFNYVIKTGDIHRLFSELEYFQKEVHSYSVSTVSKDFLKTYAGQNFGAIMDVDPQDVLFVLRQMRWDIGVTDKNEQSLNAFIQRHLKEDQRLQAQDPQYQPNVLYNAYATSEPVDLVPQDITQATEQQSDPSRTVIDPTAMGTAELEGKYAENNELIVRNSARFKPKGFLFIAREGEDFNETVDEFLNMSFGRPIFEKLKAQQLPVVIVAEKGGDLETAKRIFAERFPEFAQTSAGKFVYQRREQAPVTERRGLNALDQNLAFASQTLDQAMLGDWKESIFGFLARKNRQPLKDSSLTFNQSTATPLEYYAPYRRLFRAKGKGKKKLDIFPVLNNPAEMQKRVRTSFRNIKPQKLDFLIQRQSSSIEQSILELVSNASDALTGRRAPIGRFGFGALQMLAFVLDENNPALDNGAHVVVDTAAEPGKGRRIVFFKGTDGQIYFETQATSKPEKGTKVAIQFPQGIPETLKISIEEHLRQRLNLFTKMKVALNGEVLNTLERYQFLNGQDVGYELDDQSVDIQVKDYEISVEDFGEGMSDEVIFNKYLIPRLGQNQAFEQTDEEIAQDVHIFFKESQYSPLPRKSRIVFQVSGVNIQETTIEGYNLPEEMIIQLPASTLLTTSRDTIEIDDSTHTAVKALADKIMKAQYNQQQRNSLINGLVRAMAIADEKNGRTKVSQSLVDTVKDKLLESLLALDAPVLPNQPEYHEIVSSADTIFLEPELMYKLTPEQIPGSQEITGFKKGTFKKAFFVPFKEDSTLTYLPLGPYLLFNKKVYDKNQDKPLPLNFRLNFYVGYGPRQPTKGRILTKEEAAELEKVSIISLLEAHQNLSAVIPVQQMQWLDRYLEEQPQNRLQLEQLLKVLDEFVATLPNTIRDQIDTEQWREILPFTVDRQSQLEALIAQPQIIMQARAQFLQKHMAFFLNREHPERLERYLSNLFVANGLANLADQDVLHATLSAVDAKALRYLDQDTFEKITEVFEGKNLEAYEEAFATVNLGLPHVTDEGVNRLVTRWLRVYALDPERAKRFHHKMERVYGRQAPVRKKAVTTQAHRLESDSIAQDTFDIFGKDNEGNVLLFTRDTGIKLKGLPVLVSQNQDTEVTFYTYDRLTKEKTVLAAFYSRWTLTIKDVLWTGIVNDNNQYLFTVTDRNQTAVIGIDFDEPDFGKRGELLRNVPFSQVGQEEHQKVRLLKETLPGKVLVALLGDTEVDFIELDQETGAVKLLKESRIAAGGVQTNADFYDSGIMVEGKRLFILKRDALDNFFLYDEKSGQFIPYSEPLRLINARQLGEHTLPVQSESGDKRLLSWLDGKLVVSEFLPHKRKMLKSRSATFDTPEVDAFFQVAGLNDSQGSPIVVAYNQEKMLATIVSVDPVKMTINKIGELPLGQIRKMKTDLRPPLHSVEYIADDNLLLFNSSFGALLFDLEPYVRQAERRRSFVDRGVDVLSNESRFPEELQAATATDLEKELRLHQTTLPDKNGRRIMLVNSADPALGRQMIYEWDTVTGAFVSKDTLAEPVNPETTVATGLQRDGQDIFFTISHREWGSRIKTFSYDRVAGRIRENIIDDKVLPRTNFNKIIKTNLGTAQRPVFIAQRDDGLFFQVFSVEANGEIQGDLRLRNPGDRELDAANPMLAYHDGTQGRFFVDQEKSVDVFEYNPLDGSVHWVSSTPKPSAQVGLPMVPVAGTAKEMFLGVDREGYVVSHNLTEAETGRLFVEASRSDVQTEVTFSAAGELTSPRPLLEKLEGLVSAQGNPLYALSNRDTVYIFSVDRQDGTIKTIKEINLSTAALFQDIVTENEAPVKHIEYDTQTKRILFTLPNGILGVDLNGFLLDTKVQPREQIRQRKIHSPSDFPDKTTRVIKPDDGKTQYFRPTGLVDNLGEELFIKSELNGPTHVYSYNVQDKTFTQLGELTADVGSTVKWTGHSTADGQAVFSSLIGEGKAVRFHFYDIVNSMEQDPQMFAPLPSFGLIDEVIPTTLGEEQRPIFALRNKQAVQLVQLDLETRTITPVSDVFDDRRPGNDMTSVTSTALTAEGNPVLIINRETWDQYVGWDSQARRIKFLRNVKRPNLDPLVPSVPVIAADGKSERIVAATPNGFLASVMSKEAEFFGRYFQPSDKLDESFYLIPNLHNKSFGRILNLVALEGLTYNNGPVFAAYTEENRLVIFSVNTDAFGKLTVLKNYFAGIQGVENRRDIHFSPQTGLLTLGSSSGLAILDLNETFKAPEVKPSITTRRALSPVAPMPKEAQYSVTTDKDEMTFMQPTRLSTAQGEQIFLKDHADGATEVYAYDRQAKASRRVGAMDGVLENTKWTGLRDAQGRAIFTSKINTFTLRVHYFDLEKGEEVFHKDYNPDTAFGIFEDILPMNFGTDKEPILAIRNRDTVQLVQMNIADGTLRGITEPLRDLGGSIVDITGSHLIRDGNPIFVLNHYIKDQYVVWDRVNQKLEVLKSASRLSASAFTKMTPVSPDGENNLVVSSSSSGRIMVARKAELDLLLPTYQASTDTDTSFYKSLQLSDERFEQLTNLFALYGLFDKKGNAVFAAFTMQNNMVLFSVDAQTGKPEVLEEYGLGDLFDDFEEDKEGPRAKRHIQFDPETGLLLYGSTAGLSVIDLNKVLGPKRMEPTAQVQPADIPRDIPDQFNLKQALAQASDHRVGEPSLLLGNDVLVRTVHTGNVNLEYSQATQYVTSQGEQVFIEKNLDQPAVVYAYHPRSKQVRKVGELSEESARTVWLGDMDADGNPILISATQTNKAIFEYFDMAKGEVTQTKEFVLQDPANPVLFVKKTSMGSEAKPVYAVVTSMGLEFVELNITDKDLTKYGDTLDARDQEDPSNWILDFIEERSTNIDFNFILNRRNSYRTYRFMFDNGEFMPSDAIPKPPAVQDTPIVRTRTSRGDMLSVFLNQDGRIEASIGTQVFGDSDKTYGHVRNIIPLDGLTDAAYNPIFLVIDANALIGFVSIDDDANVTDLEDAQLDQVKDTFGRMGQFLSRDAQYSPLTGLLTFSSDEGLIMFDIKAALTKKSRTEVQQVLTGAEEDAALPWVAPKERSGFEALDQRDDDLTGLPAAVRNIVRFLKEEDIDFIEEEEPDARPNTWRRTNQLKEPLSLAMVNFIFEFYAQQIDANPDMTMDDLVALLEQNKDVELQDYIDTMLSAIAGQDKTQHAWIREMIQNARDAMRTEREEGRLAKETGSVNLRNFTHQGQWLYSIRDLGGMSLWKLLRYYFPLDQSSKDFLKDTGNLGQGNYTLFADFDQIFIRTSTGDGTVNEITIEPNAELGPVITQWEQWQGEYKGTEIRKIKKVKGSDPQLESLFIQDAMEHYTGAIQSPASRRARGEEVRDRDMEVRYKGETYSETIDITSSRSLGENWGTLSVGRGQDLFRRRVIQDEIFVKDPDAKELKLVPEWLLADFERYGSLHIAISKNILLNIPRTGYSQEHKFLQRLQVSVLHQMMRTVLEDSWEQPGEIFGMPPEYFGDMSVVDEPHAREIAELMAAGRYDAVSEQMLAPYLSSPVRFFELMSHVLFDNKSGAETSLFEIREAMLEEAELRQARKGLKGRKKSSFRDIFKGKAPTGSIASFIKDVAGDRVFETKEMGGKLEKERRAVQEEKPFDVLDHITPEAKLRFDYISHLLVKAVADYGRTDMPPLSYFYRENNVEAHTVGHRVIEWNLYNMRHMIKELERLAQDPDRLRESLRQDENSPVWRMLEVVLHEPGHLARWHKPGGHTHHHQEQVDEGFASNMGKFIDVVLSQFDLTQELTRSPAYMQRYLSDVDRAMLGEFAEIREYFPRQFEITQRLNALINDPRMQAFVYKDSKRVKFSSFADALELLMQFAGENPDLAADIDLAIEMLSLEPEQAAVILYGMDPSVLKRLSYIQTKEWTTRLRMKRFELTLSQDETLAKIWRQYESQARTEAERLWWREMRERATPSWQSLGTAQQQPVVFDAFQEQLQAFTSLTDRTFADAVTAWFMAERNQDLSEEQHRQLERFASLLAPTDIVSGNLESAGNLYDLRVQLETKKEFPYIAYDAAYHAVRILREAGFQAGLVKRQNPQDARQVYYYAQVSLLDNDFILDLVADQHEIAQAADASRLIFRPTFRKMGIVAVPAVLAQSAGHRGRLPFYTTWDIAEAETDGTTDAALLTAWTKQDFMTSGRNPRLTFKLYSELSETEQEIYEDRLIAVQAEQALSEELIDGIKKDAVLAYITAEDGQGGLQRDLIGTYVLHDLDHVATDGAAAEGGIDIPQTWQRSRAGFVLYEKVLGHLKSMGMKTFTMQIWSSKESLAFHHALIAHLKKFGVTLEDGKEVQYYPDRPDLLRSITVHLDQFNAPRWVGEDQARVVFDQDGRMQVSSYDQAMLTHWGKADFISQGADHRLSFKLYSQLSRSEQEKYADAMESLRGERYLEDADGEEEDAFVAVLTARDKGTGWVHESVVGVQAFDLPAKWDTPQVRAQGIDVAPEWYQSNIARLLRDKTYRHLQEKGARIMHIMDIKQSQGTQVFHTKEIDRLREHGIVFSAGDILYYDDAPDQLKTVSIHLKDYQPAAWSALRETAVVFDDQGKMTIDPAARTDWSKADFVEQGVNQQLAIKLFSQLSDAERLRYAPAIQALTETGMVQEIDGQKQDAFIAVMTAEDAGGQRHEQVLGMQGFAAPAQAVAGSLAAQGVEVVTDWRQSNIGRYLRAKMYHYLQQQGITDVRLSVVVDESTQQFHQREITRLQKRGVVFGDLDVRYRPGYGQDSISQVRVNLDTYTPEVDIAQDPVRVSFDQANKVVFAEQTVDSALLSTRLRNNILSASKGVLKDLDTSIAKAIRIQDKRVFGKNPFVGAVILGYPAQDVDWFLRRGTAGAIDENDLAYPSGQQWVHNGTPDFLGESQEAQDLLDLWGDSIHAVQNLMNAVRKDLPLDFDSEPAIHPQRMEMFADLTKELIANDDFEAVEYLEKALDPTFIVFLLGVKKAGYYLFNGDRKIVARVLQTKALSNQGIRSIVNPWKDDIMGHSLILYRPVDVVENLKLLKQNGWLERILREDVTFLFDKIDQMDRAMLGADKHTISEAAFNVSKLEPVVAAIDQFKSVAAFSSAGFDRHASSLRKIGQEAGLKGDTMYYPYGGFDAHTPFSVQPDVQDVYVMGLENFGSVQDIVTLAASPYRVDKSGRNYDQFDSNDDMQEMLKRNGLQGLGALAVTRIISFLKADIQGIYFFNVTQEGQFDFVQEDQVDRDQSYANAVIEFTDPQTNETKRFWYLQNNVFNPTVNFANFINNLAFQSLFVKGAPHMWSGDRRESSVALTLTPARRNKAAVLTDKPLLPDNTVDMRGVLGRRNIWKQDYQTGTIVSDIFLGYTAPGQELSYGSAEGLVTLADAMIDEDQPQGVDTDKAMLPDAKTDAPKAKENVGGIDFNPDNLELRSSGESVPFDVPEIDIKSFDTPGFTGFTPVIMDIVPVTSFPMLLGTVSNEKPDQLSKVFR